MSRDEFIRLYMGNSGIADYRVEGDRVYFAESCCRCVLPCRCGEEGCEGWAMVPPSNREFHLFQNDVEGALPYEEAIAKDMETMDAEDARRVATGNRY